MYRIASAIPPFARNIFFFNLKYFICMQIEKFSLNKKMQVKIVLLACLEEVLHEKMHIKKVMCFYEFLVVALQKLTLHKKFCKIHLTHLMYI